MNDLLNRDRRRKRVSLPLAFAAWVCALATTQAAGATLSGPEMVERVNTLRAASGLSAVTEVPEWSAACRAHVNWTALNQRFRHGEEPGTPGYSPEGDEISRRSVLAASFAPTTQPLTWQGLEGTWEAAPFHQLSLLNPRLMRSGGWLDPRGACMVTKDRAKGLGGAESRILSYPSSGATIPAREIARESPWTPGQMIGIPQGTLTGPTLYLMADGPWAVNAEGAVKTVRVAEATLTGPAGPVAIRALDRRTPEETHEGVLGGYWIGDPASALVMPLAPLDPGASYTLTARMTQDEPAGQYPSDAWCAATGSTIRQCQPGAAVFRRNCALNPALSYCWAGPVERTLRVTFRTSDALRGYAPEPAVTVGDVPRSSVPWSSARSGKGLRLNARRLGRHVVVTGNRRTQWVTVSWRGTSRTRAVTRRPRSALWTVRVLVPRSVRATVRVKIGPATFTKRLQPAPSKGRLPK